MSKQYKQGEGNMEPEIEKPAGYVQHKKPGLISRTLSKVKSGINMVVYAGFTGVVALAGYRALPQATQDEIYGKFIAPFAQLYSRENKPSKNDVRVNKLEAKLDQEIKKRITLEAENQKYKEADEERKAAELREKEEAEATEKARIAAELRDYKEFNKQEVIKYVDGLRKKISELKTGYNEATKDLKDYAEKERLRKSTERRVEFFSNLVKKILGGLERGEITSIEQATAEQNREIRKMSASLESELYAHDMAFKSALDDYNKETKERETFLRNGGTLKEYFVFKEKQEKERIEAEKKAAELEAKEEKTEGMKRIKVVKRDDIPMIFVEEKKTEENSPVIDLDDIKLEDILPREETEERKEEPVKLK